MDGVQSYIRTAHCYASKARPRVVCDANIVPCGVGVALKHVNESSFS